MTISEFESMLYCKPEWGSQANTSYRNQIREGIVEHFSPLSEAMRFQILNLDLLPKIEGHSISISHCDHLGGFATARVPVGFDILDRRRFNLKAIQRVSTEQELKACPDPALIWPAKESVYKLANGKFQVISEIVILNWTKIGDRFYRFENSETYGFVLEKDQFLFALSFYA